MCSEFLHFCLHCPYYSSFIFIISLGYIIVFFFFNPIFFFWGVIMDDVIIYAHPNILFFFFFFGSIVKPIPCNYVWDLFKLVRSGQTFTAHNWEKMKRRRRRRNTTPKPTEQGRKIVDLICGGWNRWVCCSFILGLCYHRWRGSRQMEIFFSYGMNLLQISENHFSQWQLFENFFLLS